MLSLTRKGPDFTSLPLLNQHDVAAAVWVTWKLPEEKGGKIPGQTSWVRGMQAVGEMGTSTLRSSLILWLGTQAAAKSSTSWEAMRNALIL